MPDENHCTFCDPLLYSSETLLYEDELFRVKCDDFPITKGHILIIPKQHVSCIGAYTSEQMAGFKQLYQKFGDFISSNFGSLSSFEHGVYGQTIFHSHVHLLPFTGHASDVIPESNKDYYPLESLDSLPDVLKTEGGYLYFKIGDTMLLANPALRAPRFFRDRYAIALGNEDRKNWREVMKNEELVATLKRENKEVVALWCKTTDGSR